MYFILFLVNIFWLETQIELKWVAFDSNRREESIDVKIYNKNVFYKGLLNVFYINWLTRHGLLADLSIVDLFFHGVVGNEAIYEASLFLTVPIDAAHRLRIMARIPTGIEHDHSIRAYQINTQAAGSGGEQEKPRVVIGLVERVYQTFSFNSSRASIKTFRKNSIL